MKQFIKGPNESFAYRFNWLRVLTSCDGLVATILSSTWSVPVGLTLGAVSFSDSHATARISGGTAGQSYIVTNTITTSEGDTITRRAKFVIAVS